MQDRASERVALLRRDGCHLSNTATAAVTAGGVVAAGRRLVAAVGFRLRLGLLARTDVVEFRPLLDAEEQGGELRQGLAGLDDVEGVLASRW